MIPSQVISHILFVKKLYIVILHLWGHTGSITFLWTPFFYLLKPFTPLLGDTEGVNSANLCLGMWNVTSLLCVDKRWLKHAGNTQLCVIKLLLSAHKPTPYFWALNMVSKTWLICEYLQYCWGLRDWDWGSGVAFLVILGCVVTDLCLCKIHTRFLLASSRLCWVQQCFCKVFVFNWHTVFFANLHDFLHQWSLYDVCGLALQKEMCHCSSVCLAQWAYVLFLMPCHIWCSQRVFTAFLTSVVLYRLRQTGCNESGVHCSMSKKDSVDILCASFCSFSNQNLLTLCKASFHCCLFGGCCMRVFAGGSWYCFSRERIWVAQLLLSSMASCRTMKSFMNTAGGSIGICIKYRSEKANRSFMYFSFYWKSSTEEVYSRDGSWLG